jgi:hypothetical protein
MKKRSFAAAAWPDDRENAFGLKVDIDAVEDATVAESDRQIVHFKGDALSGRATACLSWFVHAM